MWSMRKKAFYAFNVNDNLNLNYGWREIFWEYPVWQEDVNYATYFYEITEPMSWSEKKCLSDQLQRATISISSNIAEGAVLRAKRMSR